MSPAQFNQLAPALATRRDPAFARVKTDPSNTAFWEGKEYRISHEYSITATMVLKFVCARDFILQQQLLTCDQDAVRLAIYRSTQGVEGGTFGTTIPVRKSNFMSFIPDVTTATTITTGGTFTPNGGEVPVEVLRIRSAGATAQKATIDGDTFDERGIAAGTYYLVLSILAGNNPQGVYNLKWEERTNE